MNELGHVWKALPRRWRVVVMVLLALWTAMVVLMLSVDWHRAEAACRPYPVGPNSPTGIVGCSVYGEGTASWYAGPGVARNDCEWPWDACTTIKITAIDTGRNIVVTPTMFCDCYTGTPDERIVDLDPAALHALGLAASRGLYPVVVEPADGEHGSPPALLPDTAMQAREP